MLENKFFSYMKLYVIHVHKCIEQLVYVTYMHTCRARMGGAWALVGLLFKGVL